MIKNIIFDLGGVLVDLNKQRCIDSFDAIGFDASAYIGQYEQKGIFRDLEMGTITEKEFLEGIDCPATNEQKRQAWTNFLVALPEHRKQAILDLRAQGYHTFLLSNTNSIDWNFVLDNYINTNGRTVSDYFEDVFLSYELHVTKPDPQIFIRSLEKAGLKAEETIFIDDSAKNCAAAESVGIKTLCAIGDEWLTRLAQCL
ncbi:MAG: HAD family phosphatase [Bacteroidaceae bacterium]|nr:HAD family phosphatase [Bacteroidaceae bacterium]